jgi:hypothetical protein
MGTFPLFVPGFAGGQSAAALTLGQVFHPLAQLAAHLPGYWTGKATELNTLLRLVSLGIAGLAIYCLLRRLGAGQAMAFLLCLATTYNLRTLDLFRYGALEVWTGQLFLVAAIGHWYLRRRWLDAAWIIGSAYWLAVSGHPQMAYYGFMAAAFFALLLPFLKSAVPPGPPETPRAALRFYGWACLFTCLGIALALAYLVPFYFDFVVGNFGRHEQTYTWADGDRDSLLGTVNGFFRPLRADVHGAFGGSPLFLMAALLPLVRLFRVRIPRVVWAGWGLGLFAFLAMQGARTPVHYLLWRFLPLASSFRIADRIALVLPVLVMLLMLWAVRAPPIRLAIGRRSVAGPPVVVLAVLALVAMVIYALLPAVRVPPATPHYPAGIRALPPGLELGAFALAALALIGLIATLRPGRVAGTLVCVASCAQIALVLAFGTWTARSQPTPMFAQMAEEKHHSADFQGESGAGLYSKVVMQQLTRSQLEPFLGKLYRKHVLVPSQDAAYALMASERGPDTVVVEAGPEAIGPLTQLPVELPATVVLTRNTFNQVVFATSASWSGFLGMAYPFTGNWRAFVDGHEVPLHRANGAAHAVWLEAGAHRVELRYWSTPAVVGFALSAVTLALLGVFLALGAKVLLPRALGIAVAGAAVVSFVWFCSSLYGGQSLETQYVWAPDPPDQLRNLAYGKRTWMSAPATTQYPHLAYSGLGVDGDRTPTNAFQTARDPKAAWSVDLARVASIGSIQVWAGIGAPWNLPPLRAWLSSDGAHWTVAGEFTPRVGGFELRLQEARQARWVLLTPGAPCSLALDEVEVYPP